MHCNAAPLISWFPGKSAPTVFGKALCGRIFGEFL